MTTRGRTISFRHADMDLFLEVKSIAAREELRMGDILNEAFRMWLEAHSRRK